MVIGYMFKHPSDNQPFDCTTYDVMKSLLCKVTSRGPVKNQCIFSNSYLCHAPDIAAEGTIVYVFSYEEDQD